jgi:amidase
MSELAYDFSGQNCHYGTPLNPAAPGSIPGGSSSGCAVSAAASGSRMAAPCWRAGGGAGPSSL